LQDAHTQGLEGLILFVEGDIALRETLESNHIEEVGALIELKFYLKFQMV